MGLFRSRLTDAEKARLPPGQHLVHDFPVLHVGSIPYSEAPADWDLKLWGGVAGPLRFTLAEVRAMPASEVVADIHCVTTWTKLDTRWRGVSTRWLLDEIGVDPDVTHVIAHSEGGYTANLPVTALRDENVLLAYEFDARPLEPKHGHPLRLMVPSRYFWKSAKWLRGLEFLSRDEPGYWERYGYSNSADPWREERYAF